MGSVGAREEVSALGHFMYTRMWALPDSAYRYSPFSLKRHVLDVYKIHKKSLSRSKLRRNNLIDRINFTIIIN